MAVRIGKPSIRPALGHEPAEQQDGADADAERVVADVTALAPSQPLAPRPDAVPGAVHRAVDDLGVEGRRGHEALTTRARP